MKVLKYICAASILTASACMLWSCSDDDDNRLSDAVLASTSSLTFEAQNAAEQIITVYADADWVTEIPDWVTVSPTKGTGVTDVTVSVSENMREGAMDNPRKAKLVFKGRTLASRAEVLISQNGDKYRGVKDYKVSELPALADETVISVPSAIVVAVTTKGFVISDDTMTDNVFVSDDTQVAVGDKLALMGTKSSDAQKLPTVIECDEMRIVSHGTAVTYPAPTDLTGQIDTYTSAKRGYITVTGFFNGTTLSVSDDAKYLVSALDIPESMGLAALNGHNITLTGYYAGLAEPVHRIMVTSIVDKGAVEIVYWTEDFEWLEPWTSQTPAGDTIGSNNSDDTAQQLGTNKVDDVSTYAALLAKGYEIIATHNPDKAERKPEAQTYLQRNYLKFGLTGYQSGIVLPKIEGVPSDAHLLLTFDTCTQRQGSGVFDDTELVIIVETGTDRNDFELTVPHPETNGAYNWHKVEVDLQGVAVTPDTKITIRNADSQWPSPKALRWYLDNIKITKAE